MPIYVLILPLLSFSGYTSAMSVAVTPSQAVQTTQALNYSTRGEAIVIINRPVQDVFKLLTNVNIWPEINQGVTKAIAPQNIQVKKGISFKETIASPIPNIDDWTNEWHVETYIPNKKFVITGLETFAQVPIYSRISYEFKALAQNRTEFKRSIDVTLDEKFIKGAKPQEVEALYRFIGSQWEMSNHLKHYVEKQDQ